MHRNRSCIRHGPPFSCARVEGRRQGPCKINLPNRVRRVRFTPSSNLHTSSPAITSSSPSSANRYYLSRSESRSPWSHRPCHLNKRSASNKCHATSFVVQTTMSISSNSAAHPIASVPSASSSAAATSTSKNQLYALASRVPLIKSHSISLPKPVKLPPDLHPLPADISAYFVYPFSLESYVVDPNTPSSNTVDQLLAKHKQYLENREKDKEDRQREMLRKLAPGWHGDVLMPTNSANARKSLDVGATLEQAQSKSTQQQLQQQQGAERTPLDDLADHLAQLDALNSSATPTSGSHPQNQDQYLQQ